jgi:hypothetical protein
LLANHLVATTEFIDLFEPVRHFRAVDLEKNSFHAIRDEFVAEHLVLGSETVGSCKVIAHVPEFMLARLLSHLAVIPLQPQFSHEKPITTPEPREVKHLPKNL